MHTLEEVCELLATRFDEVTLLELLEINSFDLVDRFKDIIENDPEKFACLVEDTADGESEVEV
jgi:hypothetical protein